MTHGDCAKGTPRNRSTPSFDAPWKAPKDVLTTGAAERETTAAVASESEEARIDTVDSNMEKG